MIKKIWATILWRHEDIANSKRPDLKKKTERHYDIHLFLIPLSEFKNYLILIMFYYYLTPNLINLANNLLAK
jgi:hypothetical protein